MGLGPPRGQFKLPELSLGQDAGRARGARPSPRAPLPTTHLSPCAQHRLLLRRRPKRATSLARNSASTPAAGSFFLLRKNGIPPETNRYVFARNQLPRKSNVKRSKGKGNLALANKSPPLKGGWEVALNPKRELSEWEGGKQATRARLSTNPKPSAGVRASARSFRGAVTP